MAQTNVGDLLSEWIADAVDQHGRSESVYWDLSLGLAPDEQGNATATYTLALAMDGAVLGTRISLLGQVPFAAGHTHEGISQAVRGMLDEIREQRSRELQEPAAHRGSLIVPGQTAVSL